jgi:hypothetical protein
MIQPADAHYAVIALDGTRLCWSCGARPAVVEHRFCSGTCRANFQRIAQDPTPAVIARRCAEIQANWSTREREFRRRELVGWGNRADARQRDLEAECGWTVPEVRRSSRRR